MFSTLSEANVNETDLNRSSTIPTDSDKSTWSVHSDFDLRHGKKSINPQPHSTLCLMCQFWALPVQLQILI